MVTDFKRYYEFDDNAGEVIFHRHDTPSPWMNYLTNGMFFTMISQAGGSLSWYKSPEIWRIGRYNFYNLPTDGNGLFIYIKDKKTGKVWNPTVIPCDVKPDKWYSAHGFGYTRFHAEKDGVTVDLNCFVGTENVLIYDINISSATPREISVFACREMGLMEYLREVQWQCYCKASNNILYDEKTDSLSYEYFVDAQARPDETPKVFFAANMSSVSHDGSRKSFMGSYRDFKNPISLERGSCGNSDLKGGEALFAMQFDLTVSEKPQNLSVFLGTYGQTESVEPLLEKLRKKNYSKKEFENVKNRLKNRKEFFSVDIPDKDMQRMANVFNPLQAYVNFLVCREISFYATGTVRGVGMRDAAQDVLANILYDLPASEEKILLLLGQQYNCGKTNHYFYPVEKREPLISDRSDNHLWLVYAVYKVICESGKTDFLYKTAPYYDGGEGTVLEHIEKSVAYTINHLGEHGLPLMLGSDWNDMLSNVCKEGKGESVFVSQMLVLACKQLKEIYEITGKNDDELDEIIEQQEKVLNDYCWNEDRFIRAVSDEGLKIGNRNEKCGALWINSQSWAVMSGCSDEEKLRKCMETTVSTLDCGYGLLKLYPPLQRNYPSKEHELTFAQPGVNENGGVFCHANTWAIIAECMLGNNNEAYKIYKELIPHNIVKKFGVEKYNAEPYIYSSNIRAPMALDAGQAGVSWLSGTASWMMIALEEYIFGVKPCYKGLKIMPCIPDEWKKAVIKRRFRSCEYTIEIDNSAACGNTVKEIYLDGKKFDGEYILSSAPTASVKIIMGKKK